MLNTVSMFSIGKELNLANKFIKKAISGRVLLGRYISTLIALRYGISGPRSCSLFLWGRNGSLIISSDLTTIGYSMDVLYPWKITLKILV